MQAREALEEALKAFDGTLLFVSHDRYFIQNLADKIIEIDAKKVNTFAEKYDEYTAAKKAAREKAEQAAKAVKEEARAQAGAARRKRRKNSKSSRRKKKFPHARRRRRR